MSRPAPHAPSADNRSAENSQRADAPLDSAPSALLVDSAASTGSGGADALLDSALSAAPNGSAASTDSSRTLTPEPQTQPHSPPRQSVAQRCHTDALHCVFAFISLKELLPALHSCSQWWAAGCKEASRGLVIVIPSWSVASVCASPLRRHVADVTLHQCDDAVSCDQLRRLAALPRLTALQANVDGADVEAHLQSAAAGPDESLRQRRAEIFRALLPPRLRTFTVRFILSDAPTQALVDALPVLGDLRALSFISETADADLSPLLRLPQLSVLHMDDEPSPPQTAVVKRLAALTALKAGHPLSNRAALLDLLEPPHALQRLEEISMGYYQTIDPTLLAALLGLPALTALQPGSVAPECWAELGGLSQLRTLRLTWARVVTAAQSAALGSALHALPHLSDLTLSLKSDSESDAAPLALRLPALRVLYMSGVRLPSLSFLQHSPLIEDLSLADCMEMDADDMMHWLRTQAPPLRRLVLIHSVHLSADQESLLHPPSALLRALAEFSYHSPRQ